MPQASFLQKGDKIAITSTARHVETSEMTLGIDLAAKAGWEVRMDASIGRQHHIFAGTMAERAESLQILLDDGEIKAIWFARGGYGSLQLLPLLDWTTYMRKPKWLIGFSDICYLLNCSLNLGISAIHGPMPRTLLSSSNPQQDMTELIHCLAGNALENRWKGESYYFESAVKGRLVGGNLATLYAQYPSLSKAYFQSSLLFIEEIDEYLYQIDRMLRAMVMSGRLNGVKVVIVGQMTGVKDNEESFGVPLRSMIKEALQPLNVPILFDFPAGHEDRNQAIILGDTYELNKENEGMICLKSLQSHRDFI